MESNDAVVAESAADNDGVNQPFQGYNRMEQAYGVNLSQTHGGEESNPL